MALELKTKYAVATDGLTLTITDVTKEYHVTDNPGGWGSPNSELNQSALITLAFRELDGALTQLTPNSNQIVYDPTAVNTKQTGFVFNYLKDGHLVIHMFRLPVSLDGLETIESQVLQEGDYFYWSNGDLIWKIESGTPIPVTDFSEMIDNVGIIQNKCEGLVFIKLIQKFNEMYLQYVEERDGDCKGHEKLFQQLLAFKMDLAGAAMAFKSDLIDAAEDIIESLLKKYNLL